MTARWEERYKSQSYDQMGWYYPELDPDLVSALEELNIRSGSCLDLGTGPGTQAIELAKRGYKATGTDISKEAIRKASERSKKAIFIQDDILDSKIGEKFDFIYDRGCFHTLEKKSHQAYLKSVSKLLVPNGLLFLKTFSTMEPKSGIGPYRYSHSDIIHVFGIHFSIISINDTCYQGTRNPFPKALFTILQKRK